MDEEEREIIQHYQEQVNWLRDRVPYDDIYDFAHQLLMAAEGILAEFGEHADVQKLMNEDALLNNHISNVMSIHFMKIAGFKGIIDTSWSIKEL